MHQKIFLVEFLFLIILLLAAGCSSNSSQQQESPLFELLGSEKTNVTFSNNLSFTQDFNIYRYRNFYNGGGVAIGDINNDGLVDLYFTSNMERNRLYLNKGDLRFVDITSKAGVGGTRAWSTGVSMADVNGDGLLDIYVCNSGIVEGDDKRNELYINNGDSTFTEKAASYGLDDPSLSIHANFFDYDRDGDLDMYLVNNSYRAIGSFDQEKTIRNTRNEEGGDKLYRNDGDRFVDVSEEAGIYGSEIGFGLGASVGDLNRDGWEDLYISNDFFERDYLYINNRDGTFREVLEQQIQSVSAAAMGADIADLNGDGYPEIFVTDMLPEPESRLKQVTTFDSWERYRQYVRDGFFHQFTRNTLQLNNGDGTFSEIGRYAGVEATDWSWGANIADFDLDGRRDIFVANGILQDITNIDYLKHVSQQEVVRRIVSDTTVNFKKLIDIIPSTPIPNYAFQNRGDLKFENKSSEWGLGRPGFSNGSAYGDLDNDGDLELVINNLNSTASIYKNHAVEKNAGNWLKIDFEGTGSNVFAIGAQVTGWSNGNRWYAEQIPVRGFQSTVDHRLHLGLGNVGTLDSLIVRWPDGTVTKKTDVPANQTLKVSRELENDSKSQQRDENTINKNSVFVDITEEAGLNWTHRESNFNDFSRDPLLFHMRSTEGPALCIGDANGDGLEDFYAGGAKDQSGALFIQQDNGTFQSINNQIFAQSAESEDIDCEWFDANGDGFEDLYVASGSNELPASSSALADRLYINTGEGSFREADLGVSGWRYKTAGSVAAADYDGDGDHDLFLGVRLQPFGIGLPTQSFLLENDGSGNFTDVTQQHAPSLQQLGMVTEGQWGDIDNDGDSDLIIAGEWMPLTVLENRKGRLEPKQNTFKKDMTGWWNTVYLVDLDGDKDLDFVAGNHGENSQFEANEKQPVEIWINDFDDNGKIEHVLATYKQDSLYPMVLRHNLLEQLPYLESKYPDYKSYAEQTIFDIFSEQHLQNSYHKSVTKLKSVIGLNDGNGQFKIRELPLRAQLSPQYAALAFDLKGEGKKHILLGGNLHNVQPQVGRYASSYGVILAMQQDTLRDISGQLDFSIEGQIREIKQIDMGQNGTAILVARNNDNLKLFRIMKKN